MTRRSDFKNVEINSRPAPRPVIRLFAGELRRQDSSVSLILRWVTEGADGCTITGDARPVGNSSTDDSYQIKPTADNPLRLSYTLTAANAAGTATSRVTLEWGEVIATVPLADSPSGIAVSPDNDRAFLTTLGVQTDLTVFDTVRLKPVGPPVKLESPRGVAFLPAVPPNNARLFIAGGGGNGTVTVLDAVTLKQIGQPIKVGDNPVAFAVLPASPPDHPRVFVLNDASGGQGVVTALDGVTLRRIGQPVSVGRHSQSIALMPPVPSHPARVFVVNNMDESVTVIDAVTLLPIGQPIPIGFPVGLAAIPAVPPGNPRVFVLNFLEGTATVLDAVTLERSGSLPVGQAPTQIAVLPAAPPDNTLAFVLGESSHTVTVLDAVALKQVGQPVSLEDTPLVVAVAPDNARVFVGTQTHLSVIGPTKVAGGTSG